MGNKSPLYTPTSKAILATAKEKPLVMFLPREGCCLEDRPILYFIALKGSKISQAVMGVNSYVAIL